MGDCGMEDCSNRRCTFTYLIGQFGLAHVISGYRAGLLTVIDGFSLLALLGNSRVALSAYVIQII